MQRKDFARIRELNSFKRDISYIDRSTILHYEFPGKYNNCFLTISLNKLRFLRGLWFIHAFIINN